MDVCEVSLFVVNFKQFEDLSVVYVVVDLRNTFRDIFVVVL